MPLVKMAIDAKITLAANREFPDIVMSAAMRGRIARLKWDFCGLLYGGPAAKRLPVFQRHKRQEIGPAYQSAT